MASINLKSVFVNSEHKGTLCVSAAAAGLPKITKVNYFDNTLYARGYILIWTNSAVFRFRVTQTRWKYLPKIERRASAVFKCLCHVPLYAKRYKWTHGIKCTKGPAKRASRGALVSSGVAAAARSLPAASANQTSAHFKDVPEKVSSWLTNTFDMKIQNWKKILIPESLFPAELCFGFYFCLFLVRVRMHTPHKVSYKNLIGKMILGIFY